MTEIKICCTGAAAWAAVTGTLAAGLRGVPVTVEFDLEWAGLTPMLVAECGSVCREMVIDSRGKSVLPWECTVAGERLRLGIKGLNGDGSIKIPTTWAACGIVRESVDGAEPEESRPAPSPTIVEQINALAHKSSMDAQEAKETAAELVRRADAGEFDGKPGPPGPKGTDGTMTFEELTPEQKESLKGAQGPQGAKGDTGPAGPQGPKGETGPQGPKGNTGPQGPAGKDGYTPVKGMDYFDGAPGQPGPKGDTGAAGKDGVTPNIQIGTVTTLPAGSNATVERTGTDANPVLNFGIPRGTDSEGSQSVEVDASLTKAGAAADAAKVGSELSQLKETLATKFGWQDLQGLTDEQKVALQTAIGIRPVGEVLF